MDITDGDKQQLKKMLASEWWKVLMKIVAERIEIFNKQMSVSSHDYTKVREKKYDDLNINWALIRWMNLVLNAPYDVVNKDATDRMVEQMNDRWRKEVEKLER